MRIETTLIRDQVREAYSAGAREPSGKHPFPIGRAFAESVGYPSDLLDSLPAVVVETFAGVSNVSLFADIPDGSSVLDVGCGAGMDAIIAARQTGKSGSVVGVDFSKPMLERARVAASACAARNVGFRYGDAERLPLPDDSVDVALVNGIFNLNPDRTGIFRELARVVRPGGSVYCAELILTEPLPLAEQSCPTNWFA